MRRGLFLVLLCFLVLAWTLGSSAYAQLWWVRTVDLEDGRGQYTSLDLDSLGWWHIAYWNQQQRDLMYAYYDGANTIIDTVDRADAGLGCSLELDSLDRPHISYFGGLVSGQLRYASKIGGSWTIDTVDANNVREEFTSLALDPTTDYPRISYCGSQNLRCAWWNGSSWHIDTVDVNNWTGYWSSIALDPTRNNYPCISYVGNARLCYAWWDGSMWRLETADNTQACQYTSLAIQSSGTAHIAYSRVTPNPPFPRELRYARRNGPSNYQTEAVPYGSQFYGSSPSLGLDASNNPRISCSDDAADDLLYAHRNGTWAVQQVDYLDAVGQYTSLALKNMVVPCISYYDETNTHPKYAERVFLDVGVEAILAPPDTVELQSQQVRARIANFGSVEVTNVFNVNCTIDGWSRNVSILPPFPVGARKDTIFPNWTPPSEGVYTMCVTTELADDNPNNDSLCKDIFVARHDASVASIASPPDTVYCNYEYPVLVWVWNYGNMTETIQVYFQIPAWGIFDADTVVLAPGEGTTPNFPPLTVPALPGFYNMTAFTVLQGDNNPLNDTLTRQIVCDCLMHDGAVDAILNPPDSVNFGSAYPVEVVVHNYAQTTEDSFEVRSTIDGYNGSNWVYNLGPDASTQVNFANWSVNGVGPFQMCGFTLVPLDENPRNDTLCKDIFVRYHDGAVDTILSPPDTVVAGVPYPVQAVVWNYGTYLENSFEVRCRIDGWTASAWVNNLGPGLSTIATFPNWTPSVSGPSTACCSTLVAGDAVPSNDRFCKGIIVGVDELVGGERPTQFALSGAKPNPFSNETRIAYSVGPMAEAGHAIGHKPLAVSLRVYDLGGSLVRTLVNRVQAPGWYSVVWDGRDGEGAEVPRGVYFYSLKARHTDAGQAGDLMATRKVVLLR